MIAEPFLDDVELPFRQPDPAGAFEHFDAGLKNPVLRKMWEVKIAFFPAFIEMKDWGKAHAVVQRMRAELRFYLGQDECAAPIRRLLDELERELRP